MNPPSRRRFLAVTAMTVAAVLPLSSCGVTRGDDAGSTRLRMMIPNSPGGGYDVTGRTAVRVMEDDDITGRFEVFNVIGASGTVAMSRLKNEKGNEDLLMTMGLGVVGATFTNKSDARASKATPLARLIEDQEGVVVPKGSPYKTIDDVVAAWKKNPGKLRVGGGSAPGGPDHLFPMELARTVGVTPKKVNFISYDGGGELLPALLGSKIDIATTGLGEFSEQIKSGQIRVLAVSGDKRVAGIDAPTLKEAGVNLSFTNWRGVLAPPGVSPERRKELIALLRRMHDSPEWRKALQDNGWTDAFLTGDQFGSFLKAQDKRVETTLEELGLA
ncbi:Bug family tripartite tricarboxylate transporter substrate binding protein [Luteipulveratus flavus]|uniref:Tripartite tricarboxylate transporter substrate-binding protein n=1 Tax=Luteipulveratus flavus TaxID=3031728 RepID=A0ABT6C7C3_9MICO|nr:tripartite tricarboxylate transporter substrate-binding protein [Luteipulveratus sp. YIM 133296]MDF8264802.1 tripartite tricarboxylate transporter substrate-binding protein [Luteipulveratus sp. YIM 133296]